jgi:hypothetical protein
MGKWKVFALFYVFIRQDVYYLFSAVALNYDTET